MQSLLERCTNKDVLGAFPCIAAPVVYRAPSTSDAAEKVADIGGVPKLDRKASMVQRRGYTSDDDLDDLDSPLASLIDRSFHGERKIHAPKRSMVGAAVINASVKPKISSTAAV